MSRAGALRWLEKLRHESPAFTAYIKSYTERTEVEKILASVLDRGLFLDELVKNSAKSASGAVVFYVSGRAYVIWPPFPLAESAIYSRYEPLPLNIMLKKDWRLGLVLIRLGHYAIGLFEGERLIDGKAGTGLVHARHHKGGSSSQRFARHREKQMEYFFTRVEAHAREIIDPHLKEIDYILYGGTRDTLLQMQKQCHFFKSIEGKVVDRLLSVREPKRSTFGEAVEQAYASTVFEFRE